MPIVGGRIVNHCCDSGTEASVEGCRVTLPRFCHTVTLQAASTTRNSFGEVTLSFSGGTTSKANIRPLRGEERVEAERIGALTTHKITMPWRDEITPKKRIRFDGRSFNIESVLNLLEDNVAAEIEAVEESTD